MSCDAQWAYFVPGAVLTILCFTLGTLWLYYELVAQHTKRYASLKVEDPPKPVRKSRAEKSFGRNTRRFRFSGAGKLRQRVAAIKRKLRCLWSQGALAEWDEMDEDQQNEMWIRRVRPSRRNKARSLYSDFAYRWRYWKLISLVQKLLIVLTLTLEHYHGEPVITAASFGVIHTVMFCFNVLAQPYLDRRADLLSMSISFANIFNSLAGGLALAGFGMSDHWISAIYAINFVLPALAIGSGHLLNKRLERQRIAQGKRVGRPRDTPRMAKQRLLVERNINEYTLRLLVSWTSIVVFCSCLAGELIFIGQFQEIVSSPIWGHATPSMVSASVATCELETRMRKLEFIGFENWTAFTTNCCCMSRVASTQSPWYFDNGSVVLNSTLAASDPLIELWMCRNGSSTLYKERKRSLDVPMVREFCGNFFVDTSGRTVANYEPYWDASEARFVVAFMNPNSTVAEVVVDYW